MSLLPQLLASLVIMGGIAYLFARRNRERAGNAPLRGQIEARVCFETTLRRVSKLGTGGFDGTRGRWIPLQGPKRLIVGSDAFMISAPQALREFAFTGSGSSIAFTQLRFGLSVRDCIVITGQTGGREVQLAIASDNLLDVWEALARTGAALLGNEVPAASLTRPSGRAVRTGGYSLRGLGVALVVLLGADAAAWLAAFAFPALGAGNPPSALGVAGSLGACAAVVVFLVWFYRARVNADGRGWPQRRSPGWAIGAWFVPVINLWFPFQIMADIWRAGLPAEARANRLILPGIWWACFLAFYLVASVVPAGRANLVWYVGLPVYGTRVLLEVVTAMLVRRVSNRPPVTDNFSVV
jgi:hypothetical protein